MKRITMLLLCCLVLSMFAPLTAYAADSDFEIEGERLVGYHGTDAVVQIPEGVTVIGERAFMYNQYVEKIVIADSVDYIEKMAFAYTPKLREVHIGACVRTMYTCIFTATPSLATFTVSELNTRFYVEDGVLRQRGIGDVYYYPSGKTDTHYNIPEDVTFFRFNENQYIESVYIPKGVYEVDFANTTNLSTIEVDPASPYFTVEDGVLYSADMSTLVRYPSAKTGSEYHVPDSVRYLPMDYYAIFPHTAHLTDIYFSGSCPNVYSEDELYSWYSAFELPYAYTANSFYAHFRDSIADKVYRIHYPAGDETWDMLIAAYENDFGLGHYFDLEFIPDGGYYQGEIIDAPGPEQVQPVTFSDVTDPSAWYYDPIYASAMAGIIAGNADGTFAPADTLTWAQTVAFAVRLNQYLIGNHIYGAADQTDIWYEVYADYALEYGIIDEVVPDPNADISRADAAMIFFASLGEPWEINDVADGYFTDVAADSPAHDAIYALARMGIVNGIGEGRFGVADTFLRREAATIVARIAGFVPLVEI